MAQEINQLVEAMNAHDLDAVVQLFHSDYHSEQPAHPAREFGTSAQVRANWAAMFGGIPGKQSGCGSVDHAAWGGIQGLAVRASRMASMGRRPWLRALTR